MKDRAKTTKTTAQTPDARASAGPDGIAIAPPQNRTGLPDALKNGIESLSGLAMDDVHVHYNSSRPAQLQALAYTQGTDIHVGPGQERHLPHEAWHVVQQKQGRVQPTTQVADKAVNDSPLLEREADAMGKASHNIGCGCSNCSPGVNSSLAKSPPATIQPKSRLNLYSNTNHQKITQKKVVQRLNNVSAKAASDQAVLEIDNSIGGSSLLSGWGTSTAGYAGHSFTQKTRDDVNAIGDATGCCICGTTDPGWTPNRYNASGQHVGNFTPDHEPPDSLVSGGYTGKIKFYPHCKTHTNMQGGVVSSYKSKMKTIRAGTNSDWATGVQGSWFWN